jgi:hypothetical protein
LNAAGIAPPVAPIVFDATGTMHPMLQFTAIQSAIIASILLWEKINIHKEKISPKTWGLFYWI